MILYFLIGILVDECRETFVSDIAPASVRYQATALFPFTLYGYERPVVPKQMSIGCKQQGWMMANAFLQ